MPAWLQSKTLCRLRICRAEVKWPLPMVCVSWCQSKPSMRATISNTMALDGGDLLGVTTGKGIYCPLMVHPVSSFLSEGRSLLCMTSRRDPVMRSYAIATFQRFPTEILFDVGSRLGFKLFEDFEGPLQNLWATLYDRARKQLQPLIERSLPCHKWLT